MDEFEKKKKLVLERRIIKFFKELIRVLQKEKFLVSPVRSLFDECFDEPPTLRSRWYSPRSLLLLL